MARRIRTLLLSLTTFALAIPAFPADPASTAGPIPTTWVDKDTGHRVYRLSPEPNSGGFYFNVNAYTPDHKTMIYTAPDGIHTLDMATRKTRLLVPNPPRDPAAPRGGGANPHALVAGSKTNSVFYTQLDPATKVARSL